MSINRYEGVTGGKAVEGRMRGAGAKVQLRSAGGVKNSSAVRFPRCKRLRVSS